MFLECAAHEYGDVQCIYYATTSATAAAAAAAATTTTLSTPTRTPSILHHGCWPTPIAVCLHVTFSQKKACKLTSRNTRGQASKWAMSSSESAAIQAPSLVLLHKQMGLKKKAQVHHGGKDISEVPKEQSPDWLLFGLFCFSMCRAVPGDHPQCMCSFVVQLTWIVRICFRNSCLVCRWSWHYLLKAYCITQQQPPTDFGRVLCGDGLMGLKTICHLPIS